MKKILIHTTFLLLFLGLSFSTFAAPSSIPVTSPSKTKVQTTKKTTPSTHVKKKTSSKKKAPPKTHKKKSTSKKQPATKKSQKSTEKSERDLSENLLSPDTEAQVQEEPKASPSAEPEAISLSLQDTDDAEKPSSFLSWFRSKNTSDQDTTIEKSTPHGTNPTAGSVTKLAHNTVATLHYSRYSFGGNHFDPKKGIYMLDCSGYIDNMLNQSSPKAYSMLAQSTGSDKPSSAHYYNFFNRLSAKPSSQSVAQRWNKIENPRELEAGDILVFRYTNARGRASGGHVMLVMNKPEKNASVFRVRVADSAKTGHSADTRGRHSGIGIGTLLLKVNPATNKAYAFAWRVDSPWNTRVDIAMGRPPTALTRTG
jgi:hypothetical protein